MLFSLCVLPSPVCIKGLRRISCRLLITCMSMVSALGQYIVFGSDLKRQLRFQTPQMFLPLPYQWLGHSQYCALITDGTILYDSSYSADPPPSIAANLLPHLSHPEMTSWPPLSHYMQEVWLNTHDIHATR